MKQLVTIALASLVVGFAPVFAQGDALATGTFIEFGESHDLVASDLIGTDLYVSPLPVTLARVEELPEDWERVARIGDLVIGRDGSVRGFLVDIGGFLGIGARTVAVDIDQLEIFHDPQTNDVAVYINMTEQELEALPEYRR